MIEFNAYWTPVFTGETTFYETINIDSFGRCVLVLGIYLRFAAWSL